MYYIVVFCCELSKSVSLHLATDYSAKTFKDILCTFASINGMPLRLKMDAQSSMLTVLGEISTLTQKTFQSNYAKHFLAKYKLTVKVARELASLSEMTPEEQRTYAANHNIPRSKEE